LGKVAGPARFVKDIAGPAPVAERCRSWVCDDQPMAQAASGRRESNKDKTREAIRQAARRLIAEHGYEATSVREIAEAAGVGERTFYRYFGSKDGLIADETQEWLAILQHEITSRPPSETPLVAVKQAMVAVAKRAAEDAGSVPTWLFNNRPRPVGLVQRSTPRPLLLFESALTEALLTRLRINPGPAALTHDPSTVFQAQLMARISVAILRTVAIRRYELLTTGETEPPKDHLLIAQAFESLTDLTHAGG